eukprot:5586035-Ditylum_brightwellii.AAC.1
MAHTRDKYYKNKGVSLGDEKDFKRHGSLAADSFTIKDKIVYDFHSHQMKGFADETWNHVDAIGAALSSNVENGNEDQKSTLESACHYYVIFFSAWCGNERPFTFIAACFAVKILSFHYLFD